MAQTDSMIVGLTGPNAAGKGEAAHYLESRGFAYHSLSDVVREEATRRGLDHSRENLIGAGNDLRARFGAGVLAERIAAVLLGRGGDEAGASRAPGGAGRVGGAGGAGEPLRAIVDSMRSPAEVAVLRRLPGFLLVGIDAPVAVRFARSLRRGRMGDGATLEEFARKETLENTTNPAAQQLSQTFLLADLVVDNSGTLEELHARLAAALRLEP